MADRTRANIKISRWAFEQLKERKPEDATWGEWLMEETGCRT